MGLTAVSIGNFVSLIAPKLGQVLGKTNWLGGFIKVNAKKIL